MAWWHRFLRDSDLEREAALRLVQERFGAFLALLAGNNRVLKVIADMEEKAQGEHLFDINYVRAASTEVHAGVAEIVERMIALGGELYLPLRERRTAIAAEIDAILEGGRAVPRDEYTIPLEALGQDRAGSVGGKNANLGELKSRLGLPVPEGFAISAWAYRRFVEANQLQTRITAHVRSLDIRRIEDLEHASRTIQAMVVSSTVPEDVAGAISTACAALETRAGADRFSLRSSAVGEDTLHSFAGQYATFLNLRREQVLERYRQVLAGKFSPQAIYYLLSHDLRETDLAMSVSCVAMVDAAASGVVYSRDPLRPEEGDVLVHAVLGLGRYLVDGTVTPDVFRLSRADGSIRAAWVARKRVRLVARPEGDVDEEAVPEADQVSAALSEEQLRRLAEHAVRIEGHYKAAQDIEWAVDRQGRILLLQTRPLRVFRRSADIREVDLTGLDRVWSGGVTVCPGAGAGAVFHVSSGSDLKAVPEAAVVVSSRPFPALVTAMGRMRALVTEVGGVASHLATLAREYRVPTLAGVERAGDLPAGQVVTVDATGAAIYRGEHPRLVAARRPEYELFEDTEIYLLLGRVLEKVAPLNLLHPSDPGFRPDRCATYHDITRFAHQRAMEEMFSEAKDVGRRERLGLRLRTSIPLEVHIIYVDRQPSRAKAGGWVEEHEVASIPMQALWAGIKEEGWPAQARPVNLSGFVSVMTTQMGTGTRDEFGEASFALLSREYMVLSLHLGYHFTTFEAMCSPDPSRNYVRMQFKGGGASLDRRTRRIRLVMDLLSRLGFEHSSKGDFLDSTLAYAETPALVEKLRLLGRITMLTKQLDMALSNDAVARWYAEDFAKKLGLPGETKGWG